MRFFMFLSPCSEKPQSVFLPATATFSSQPLAFPVCQGVVGFSLGFSGFLSLFCAPALADFSEATAQTSTAVAGSTTLMPISGVPISGLLTESTSAAGASAAITAASKDYAIALHATAPQGDQLAFTSETSAAEDFASDAVAVPNWQAVPSLSASAQAIYARDFAVSFEESGSPYGGYQVAVEDAHQPQFASSTCGFSVCKGDEDTLRKKKPDVSEAAGEVVTLLNHPALTHVTQTEISSETEALTRVRQEAGVLDAIDLEEAVEGSMNGDSVLVAQVPDFFAGREREIPQDVVQGEALPDEELGSLRLRLQRSRDSEELGILRLLQTAQAAPPPPPAPPVAFISGRLGFFATENVFRAPNRLDDRIMQSGITAYYFPQLSENTNLYAIAETSLARYGNLGANYTGGDLRLGSEFTTSDYNQTDLQLGVRQRLLPRTYAQIGLRNQRIYSPGYRDKLFGINYLEAQLNHRSILNSRLWLDSFYQVRWGLALPIDSDSKANTPPSDSSRLRQTFTLSLNYSATPDLRTSLLYQLDFEDYTKMSRFDYYQQVIGIVSYNLTPESQLSVFGGTRFGRSSSAAVNLDDTFYGAGLNISVPIF